MCEVESLAVPGISVACVYCNLFATTTLLRLSIAFVSKAKLNPDTNANPIRPGSVHAVSNGVLMASASGVVALGHCRSGQEERWQCGRAHQPPPAVRKHAATVCGPRL